MSVRTSKLLSLTAVLLGALAGPAAVGAGGLCATGCMLGGRGPSAVAQGTQFTSGNPTYDEFFTELYEIQVDLGKAQDATRGVRAPLAEAVGAEEDASLVLIAKKVRKKTEKLAEDGTGLELKLPDEDDEDSKLSVTVVGKDPDEESAKLVKTIETTAKKLQKLIAKMKRYKKQLEEMPAKISALRVEIDTAFRTSMSKKSEVKKNLDDAEKLIPLMLQRATQTAKDAETGLSKLADATTTRERVKPEGPPEGGTPPADDGSKPKPKPSGSSTAKPPADGGSTPKPKPPGGGSSPPPKGDFEP